SCPMLKCSSERWVCAPQSLSAGTSTSPRLSVSLRMSVIFFLLSTGAYAGTSEAVHADLFSASIFRPCAEDTISQGLYRVRHTKQCILGFRSPARSHWPDGSLLRHS